MLNNKLDLSLTRERDQLTDGHRDNYIGHRAKIGDISTPTPSSASPRCGIKNQLRKNTQKQL